MQGWRGGEQQDGAGVHAACWQQMACGAGQVRGHGHALFTSKHSHVGTSLLCTDDLQCSTAQHPRMPRHATPQHTTPQPAASRPGPRPRPAAVLLIRAAQRWREQHDGLPKTAAQRSDFKHLIKSWQRQVDGFPLDVSGAACLIGWLGIVAVFLRTHAMAGNSTASVNSTVQWMLKRGNPGHSCTTLPWGLCAAWWPLP